MVRPERLFALRAHPFGVALRAINLACGQVVELGLLSPMKRKFRWLIFNEELVGLRFDRREGKAQRECSFS